MKILVCTTSERHLPILKASLQSYAPELELVVAGPGGQFENPAKNFGDAYNAIMERVMGEETECIIANDDVVLTPTSTQKLLEDVAALKKVTEKLGFVGARADYAPVHQNVFYTAGPKGYDEFRYHDTLMNLFEASWVAPFFAWISREAFQAAQFPPINWYSDNVICADLAAKGFRHFVSRSYVHHTGQQSTGRDEVKLVNDARPWVEANRPEYARLWFGPATR